MVKKGEWKMKNIIWKISIIFVCAFLIAFGGFMGGYGIANDLAFRSVCNSEETDIVELLIEQDYNVTIFQSYYNYENGTGYVTVRDNTNEEHIYTINLKVQKYKPFRYEWLEVEL